MLLLLRPTSIFSPTTSLRLLKISFAPVPQSIPYRTLTTTPTLNMPDTLKASDVESKTDPTVSNQWDDQTPKKQQIDDFYKTVDGMKIGLLSTIRDGIGPVARSMAVAKVPSSSLTNPAHGWERVIGNKLTRLASTARRTRLPLSRQPTLQQIQRPRQRQDRPPYIPKLIFPRLGLRHRHRSHHLQL